MKSDGRYWGSVRFYKHFILFITASLILLPTVGLIFMLTQYGKLKRNSDNKANEQQLCISQLEEKLALYEEQWEDRDTYIFEETRESEQVQETTEEQEIAEQAITEPVTTEDDVLLIPFAVDPGEIKYTLVNDSNPLPQCYPMTLVETRNGKMVHKEIRASLEQMIDDAKEEGFEIIICSAYRDYKKQAELVDKSIRKYLKAGYDYEEAFFKTRCYLEMVGRSEHHTGLAVDLVGIDYQALDEGQANTPESIWLHEHASEYGFILRYPDNKEDITGIMYESWHFRYVGEEAAIFMKENQLCLEEFLDLASRQDEKQTENAEK